MNLIDLIATIEGVTISTKYFDKFGGIYETVYFDDNGIMSGVENNKLTFELTDAIKAHNHMVAQLIERIN